jgi:uncharacterized protein
MVHPSTELRCVNDRIGNGVYAMTMIPRGTIIWTLCASDKLFTEQQVREMPQEYQNYLATYAYINAEGLYVLCCDNGRYMNHCCEPTNLGIGENVEIAVRDILPGEQVTCEYGTLNLNGTLECHCGSPRCRGIIRSDDVMRYGAEWDAIVRLALPFGLQVPQPLFPFVAEADAMLSIMRGESPLPSHTLNFHATNNGGRVEHASARRLWSLPERAD